MGGFFGRFTNRMRFWDNELAVAYSLIAHYFSRWMVRGSRVRTLAGDLLLTVSRDTHTDVLVKSDTRPI